MKSLYETIRDAKVYIKKEGKYIKNRRGSVVCKGTRLLFHDSDDYYWSIQGMPEYYLLKKDLKLSTPSNKPKIGILMYHFFYDNSIGENKRDHNHMDKKVFSEHMTYLKDNNYNIIDGNQLIDYLSSNKKIPPKTIMITIDDCSITAYKYAFPILKQLGLKATFFMITSRVKDNYNEQSWHITERMYQEMKATGLIDFESHSHNAHQEDNHHQGVLLSMNKQEIINDLKLSVDYLNNCNIFCYPYGSYNSIVKDSLLEVGFKAAVTTHFGKASKEDDIYFLPRLRIEDTMTLDDFICTIDN